MNDQELSQTLAEAYNSAPQAVQTFVTSGRLEQFIEKMQQKYQLHIDVAGRLSDELLMLLLGITGPGEIVQTLSEQVLIPQVQVGPLLADINEGVFKTIRGQEEAGFAAQLPQNPPQKPVVPPIPMQERTPPPPMLPPPAVFEQPAPPLVPLTVQAPPSMPIPKIERPPAPVAAAPPAAPIFVPPPPINLPGAFTETVLPQSLPQVAPIPIQIRPPAPVPPRPQLQAGIAPVSRAINPAPRPMPQAMPKPITPPPTPTREESKEALHSVLKQYGVDPYRETPE